MSGLGAAPFGTSPLGYGTPSLAPVPAPYVASPFATTAPRLDPKTKQIVMANGSPQLADGVEQRVLIRLSMDKGSSAIRTLGNELRKIDRITDNYAKRVDTTVRAALADMVSSREIAIVAVNTQRIGTTGVYAQVQWRRVADGAVLTTDVGGSSLAPVTATTFGPLLISGTPSSIAGGPVIFVGERFTSDVVIKTDGVARPTSFVDSRRVLATVPAHAVGNVTAQAFQLSGVSNLAILAYVSGGVVAPTFTSATAVSAAGGTTTITGTGFTSDAAVTSSFTLGTTTFVNATSLQVVIPAHAAGTFDVTVTQASGNVTGTAALAIVSVATVTSASGVSTAGGTTTVVGTNFDAGTVVWSDGAARATTYNSPTSLSAVLPAHAAGTVSFNVVKAVSGASNSITVTYAVPAGATLTSASGVTTAGGSTTLTGNFLPGDTAVIDGAVVSGTTYVNATTLTAPAPAHAAGNVNVYVQRSGAANSGTVSLTYTAVAAGISSLTLAVYNQQGKGAATDYNPAATPTTQLWKGIASAGGSGARYVGAGLNYAAPPLGAAIDGTARINYTSAAQQLAPQSTAAALGGTATNFAFAMLIRINGAGTGRLCTTLDAGGNIGSTSMYFQSTGGTAFDLRFGSMSPVSLPCTVGTWALLIGRLEAGQVYLTKFQGGARTDAGPIAAGTFDPSLFVGDGDVAQGSPLHDRLAWIINGTLDATAITTIITQLRADYPTTGI